eukprot:6195950-Pleurochrysis_carterae.AAC.2
MVPALDPRASSTRSLLANTFSLRNGIRNDPCCWERVRAYIHAICRTTKRQAIRKTIDKGTRCPSLELRPATNDLALTRNDDQKELRGLQRRHVLWARTHRECHVRRSEVPSDVLRRKEEGTSRTRFNAASSQCKAASVRARVGSACKAVPNGCCVEFTTSVLLDRKCEGALLPLEACPSELPVYESINFGAKCRASCFTGLSTDERK